MDIRDNVLQSEKGAEAAWRGFSTQTLYIAGRLLECDDNELEFYPEQVEDLLVKRGKSISELVQVKNLTKDLSLSDLSPQKQDSFFRRCLKYKDNEEIILKVVSFGNVGSEMLTLLQADSRTETSIAKKLVSYGYAIEDVEWLLTHLQVEKVSEDVLQKNIQVEMRKYIEIAAATELAYEVLIYYIYKLSRETEHTSKKRWEEKISNIARNIASIDSLSKQYHKTIIPLSEFKSNESVEQLLCDYRIGVNAVPDHIRNRCDLYRKRWIEEIDKRFERNNIVLVRGASGQGKSTLAYRYFIDNYPELSVMCIQKVISEEQAIDILSILRGLNDRKDIAVYLDVEPYDVHWLWICEKAVELGVDFKILITIREEDFQRSAIDYSKHHFEEIALEFSKNEAMEIYDMYSQKQYLSFEEAWKSFGEKGPLMEYIFMLNESDTMVERVRAQIQNIILHEEDADDWLECLAVISLAGIHNNRVAISNLFEQVNCSKKNKMISCFEKEYFIKMTDDKAYLESLHALRARIIYKVILEKGVYNLEKILLNTLGIIEHNATEMVIEYAYENGMTEELVKRIASIRYLNIEAYADVVKALLWCEVYHFLSTNRDVITEGDSIFNNNFSMLGIGDITGLLQIDVFKDMCKVFNNINETFEEKMTELKAKLPMKKIDYRFLDCFFKNNYSQLLSQYNIIEANLNAWGYVLFWLACRNFYLEECEIESVDWSVDIEASLNFALGATKQKWFNIRQCIAGTILPKVYEDNGIIYYEVSETEIFALLDALQDEMGENESTHKRVMKVVNISQRLFPEKDKYNAKIIGYSFVGDINIPDIQKHIPKEKLPYVWLTQINGCFLKLQEYQHLPDDWQITFELITNARKAIIEYFSVFARNLEIAYKKNDFRGFSSIEYQNKKKKASDLSSKNPYINPKCAVDRYGLENNNYVVRNKENKYTSERNVESDKKHISHLCHEYFSQIQAFCSNGENIVMDAINKREKGREARIAYYSLIQALMHLDAFQQKFDEHFSVLGEFPDKEEEKEILERLAIIFTIIYANNFSIEKSINYKAKLSARATEKKIEEFLSEGIRLLPGIKRISGTSSNPVVEVNVFEYEDFLKQFFTGIKGLAKEMDNVSLAGYLLMKHFKQLQIHIICEGESRFPSINVKVRDVLIYSDYDKFVNMILPNEEVKDSTLINVTQAGVVGIGAIELMKKLFRYVVEIENELKANSTEYIVKSIYDSYRSKTLNLVEEAAKSFKTACEYVALNATENIVEVQETKTILCECAEQIEQDIFVLVEENGLEEIIPVLDGFMEKFCHFVDVSGAVANN